MDLFLVGGTILTNRLLLANMGLQGKHSALAARTRKTKP